MIARVITIGLGLCVALVSLALLNIERLLPNESLSPDTLIGLQIGAILSAILATTIFAFHQIITRFINKLIGDSIVLSKDSKQVIGTILHRDNRLYLVSVLVLMLLAGGLRLLYLNQPMRTDESWTFVVYASKPIYLALSDYSAPNNHLLHTLGVWLTTRLFGAEEWSIRLTAFLSGIMMIPMIFEMVRVYYDKRVALLTAGLVAVASVLIEYSTNARGYTLQMVLIFCSYRIAYALRTSNNSALWGLFALISALALYTIPTGIYAIAGIFLWLLVTIYHQKHWQILSYWLASGIAMAVMVIIAYTPVIIVTGLSSITQNSYVTALSWGEFANKITEMLIATTTQWHISIPLPVTILLIIGFVTGLIRHRQMSHDAISLVYPLLAVILILLLIQRVAPFTRVWLYLLPIYFAISASGIIWWSDRLNYPRIISIIGIFVVMWGAVNIIQSNSPYHSIETGTFRDAEAVISTIANRDDALPIIYEHPSGESMRYYATIQGLDVSRLGANVSSPFYLVVNSEYPQTPQTVFQNNGLRAENYTIRLLNQYPLAQLYEVIEN